MCHCGCMHWQVEVVAVFLRTIFCLFEVVIRGRETRHMFGTHSAHITRTLSNGGAAKRRKFVSRVCRKAT